MTPLQVAIGTEGAELQSDHPFSFPIGRFATLGAATTIRPPVELLILEGLWADGLAEQLNPGRWLVGWEQMLGVEDADAHALRLPRPEAVSVELRARGIPTSSDFAIEPVVRHPQLGVLDLQQRRGPAVPALERTVLLPEDVWKLIVRTEDRPGESAASDDRLEYLGLCKAAAGEVGAQLDGFLARQEIEIADALALDVAEDGGALVLTPQIPAAPQQSPVLANGLSRRTLRTTGADGTTRRVVLKPAVREQVEAVARVGRLEGEKVPAFLTNPEAFLPEGLDLSNFSKRVIGFNVRVYNSRPYLHVKSESRGWFEFESGISLENTGVTGGDSADRSGSLSVDEYEGLARQAREAGQRWVQHGDSWVEVDPDASDKFLKTVRHLERHRGADGRVRRSVVLEVISNVESLGFEVALPQLDEEGGRAWLEELPLVDPPQSFRATLDPHQLTGFRWLAYLHQKGAGGLLADEMGVGKTPQVIAHLCALQEAGALMPALIIVPKSLIQNWHQELRRFAPLLNDIVIHEGPGRPRTTEYLAAHDVVLTTYDTVRSDQVGLGVIDWRFIALDEAQFIKNPTAGRTSAVKALKCDQLVAMTGTPVENGLIEFWSILDRVRPGLLGGWSDFRREFEKPLSEAGEDDRQQIVEELLTRLDPHYLRRMKEQVLADLLPKTIVPEIEVDLSPQQTTQYRAVLADAKEKGRGAALAAIGALLRICSHPRAETQDWDTVSGEQLAAECPKLSSTLEIIDEIRAKDEKVLIFAEWKSTQRILQRAIAERFGCWPEVINGDVTTRRQELVDLFCALPGFAVMILSPKVAGYGLNIVQANHVIHYTRPWNPAVENQATDRVHRRGQDKPVFVYYPTIRGTVEQKLAQLLRDKADLARDVLRPSSERIVTVDDLMGELQQAAM